MSGRRTVVFLLFFSILCGLLFVPYPCSRVEILAVNNVDNTQDSVIANSLTEPLRGSLNPVTIEHKGSTSGMTTSSSARTDVEQSPEAEVYVPVGGSENRYSAECYGGYFLVGEDGSTSFGSPEGTISLWLKFDSVAPNGRFWGQDNDFEIRWDSNQLVLDWGAESTVQGLKNDWEIDHWYFLAITWDQSNNSLSIFWGDEVTEPIEDISIDSWFNSVVDKHTVNTIMNSLSSPSSEVYGHIDDFRYYAIQRSIADVRSDYRIPNPNMVNDLQHWYCFESDFTDCAGTSNLECISNCRLSWDVVVQDDTWIAEQLEINVMDINRLSALNGTFDEGNPGTNVDWNGDGQYYANGWYARREALTAQGRQRTAYVSSDSKYLFLENEGFELQLPTRYRHYDGTLIYWYQDVDNTHLDDQFKFSMKYNYLNGPIGLNHADEFQFRFEILNGTSVLWAWSIDPTTISSRSTWYTVPQTTFSLPVVPASFQIRVSLVVNTTTSYIEINESDSDLDGDSANGQFIGFQVDDISLTPVEFSNCQEVDLKVTFQDLGSFNIHDSLNGGMLLVNHTYWTTATIQFSFSSNNSISFDYSAKVNCMKKFTNSSSTPNLNEHGVEYRVEPNAPVELLIHTYIQSYPEATNLGFLVHFPHDWEHVVVIDPFGNNVSQHVIVSTDYLELPLGFVDSVGWWKIYMESSNYIHDLSTQSNVSSGWDDQSVFYCNGKIRGKLTLGISNETICSMVNVTFSWYDPSGVLWSSQTLSQCNNTVAFSEEITLGPSNTTIGVWYLSAKWQNGTEVAYGSETFQFHHRLTVIPNTPRMEVKQGEGFIAAIWVYDQDNGVLIPEDATVTGNWSTGTEEFRPNLSKGWYEVDLNTTHIGTGNFTILIEVSLLYYETISSVMTVYVPRSPSMIEIYFQAGLNTSIILLSLMGITFLVRRFYLSNATKNNLELLTHKGRLEDATNMTGILVIHRSSGIPLYSRIFKGGFQEALLGSFISAISHFRSELSSKEPLWVPIPISDVVTAVQTENMICAVVTDETISSTQKDTLEYMSREIGLVFDHDDMILNNIGRKTIEIEKFDLIFDRYFDSSLIQKYFGIRETLPENLNVISRIMTSMTLTNGVTPKVIINTIIRSGLLSERLAYQKVLAAIDGGHLLTASDILIPENDDFV